jgi:hypothetical protein
LFNERPQIGDKPVCVTSLLLCRGWFFACIHPRLLSCCRIPLLPPILCCRLLSRSLNWNQYGRRHCSAFLWSTNGTLGSQMGLLCLFSTGCLLLQPLSQLSLASLPLGKLLFFKDDRKNLVIVATLGTIPLPMPHLFCRFPTALVPFLIFEREATFPYLSEPQCTQLAVAQSLGPTVLHLSRLNQELVYSTSILTVQ